MVERSLRMRDAPGSIPGVSITFAILRGKKGLVRESNPGPHAPELLIIPVDQRAIIWPNNGAYDEWQDASLAQW